MMDGVMGDVVECVFWVCVLGGGMVVIGAAVEGVMAVWERLNHGVHGDTEGDGPRGAGLSDRDCMGRIGRM